MFTFEVCIWFIPGNVTVVSFYRQGTQPYLSLLHPNPLLQEAGHHHGSVLPPQSQSPPQEAVVAHFCLQRHPQQWPPSGLGPSPS
mmetsp:Transcript_45075/g.70656  ORF Transcript_45075/g.70656 Transcript_45075/m.70656 type:complete len:85 (+) Transcript_45075:36-290(+)